VLAKAGYITLGALTLARRGLREAPWRRRLWLIALLVYLSTWLGLDIRYHMGMSWGRHHVLLGELPAQSPGHVRVTTSGDFVWQSSGR
jgi:hypothetical protein